MPTIVTHQANPIIAELTAKKKQKNTIQIKFKIVEQDLVEIFTLFPNGESINEANLKH